MRNNTYFTIVLLLTICMSAYCQLNEPFETTGNNIKLNYSGISRNIAATPAPTITLTDVTNPTLNTVQGIPVSQTINISAVNLSVNLSLAISGADAGLFTLSQYTISETGGTIPNTSLTITYSPVLAGSNTVALILSSSGAVPVARSLIGNTATATEFLSPVTSLVVSVDNGNLLVKANAGESIEIYNIIGEKLMSTLTIEGLNIIPLKFHGVLLVKLGNRVAKVIN